MLIAIIKRHIKDFNSQDIGDKTESECRAYDAIQSIIDEYETLERANKKPGKRINPVDIFYNLTAGIETTNRKLQVLNDEKIKLQNEVARLRCPVGPDEYILSSKGIQYKVVQVLHNKKCAFAMSLKDDSGRMHTHKVVEIEHFYRDWTLTSLSPNLTSI